MMYGEAVVYLDHDLAAPGKFVRKQVGQLPSKMRYVAAQFDALLTDDLWLRNASNSNEMARRLYGQLSDLAPLALSEPAVNSLFPIVPRAAAEELRAWCPFYDWDPAISQYRWMAAWDTRSEDVDRFAAGVRAVVSRVHG